MKFINKLKKKYFNEQSTITVRFFNLAALGGILSSIGATIPNIINGAGAPGLICCCTCIIFFAVIFIVAQATKKYDACIFATIYGLNFLLFPALYFTVGGIYSGMPIYFVMGIVFTALMFDGKTMYITVLLECIWYGLIFGYSYNHPEIEKSIFDMGDKIYLDTALDFFVVALSTAILVKVLAKSYEYQQERTKNLLDQLEELSVKDSLTGAYNRRFLIKYIETGIEKNKKTHTPISIIMVDIDKFKTVNDDFGHLVGDDVIKGVVDIMMNSCRNYDVVARYGGEEFILVMPGASEETAYARAQQIRKKVEESDFSDALTRKITISGGVCVYDMIFKTVEQFIEGADNNLYIAKETGRNKIVWHGGND